METFIIALVPAFVSGLVSVWITRRQTKTEIEQLKISNQHEIAKLMEEHRVNLDSVREQHRLEMEAKERDHQHQMEIMQKQHENDRTGKEQDVLNGIMGTIFTGVIGNVVNSPNVQNMLAEQLLNGFKKTNN